MFVKVATVLTFIAVIAAYLLGHPFTAASNWHPFMPPNQGQFGAFGWSGAARASCISYEREMEKAIATVAASPRAKPSRTSSKPILRITRVADSRDGNLFWLRTKA